MVRKWKCAKYSIDHVTDWMMNQNNRTKDVNSIQQTHLTHPTDTSKFL